MDPEPRSERARLERSRRRWRLTALSLAAVLILSWGWYANQLDRPLTGSPRDALIAAEEGTDRARYQTEQARAEVKLLTRALAAAKEVDAHHRHHSQVMWNLLEGKITSQEAWWQGGDSTCAGWLAANEFEETVGRLKGQQVKGQPIPKQGLAFCKAARERR